MLLYGSDIEPYLPTFSAAISLTWICVFTHVCSHVNQSSILHTRFQYLYIRGVNYMGGALNFLPPTPPEVFFVAISFAVTFSRKYVLTGLQPLITSMLRYHI